MSAEAIRDYYAENSDATIQEAADALGLQLTEVHRIMDTHLVSEDGSIEEVGPGQGGGWAPPVEMVRAPREIGNRWPDGELRDEVFDIHQELHRQIVGINDEQYEAIKANG